jgi:hypothetical protein
MKRVLLCMLFASAVLPGCMAPRIVFNSIDHDFGAVGQKETLKHEFIFRNAGKQTLKIEKIHAG